MKSKLMNSISHYIVMVGMTQTQILESTRREFSKLSYIMRRQQNIIHLLRFENIAN